MSATPVAADHSEEFEQLAGLAALRALEGDELARFEQHAQHCERCRLIVRTDRETLARLSLAAPEMEPSPGFKSRLMARAAAELAQAQDVERPQPIPLRPRSGSKILQFRRSVWASALAAVFVIGVVSTSVFTYMNQVVASYTLSGTAPGEALVIVRRSGAVELEMHGVADPPSGFVYEAWIIPPGQQPMAAGVTPRGEARLPLSGSA
ncbi:MAG TPA: anti-sigma factor, partial [Chloroflexota bacterium]|nr:anti-sigma factor [Chloroflexota bacterium]